MSIFCGGGIARRAVNTNLTRDDKKLMYINRCRTGARARGGGVLPYISICHYLLTSAWRLYFGDQTLI